MTLKYILTFILIILCSNSFAEETIDNNEKIQSESKISSKTKKQKEKEKDEKKIKIVVFGDSMVSGYKVKSKYAFPKLLSRSLKSDPKYKKNTKVIDKGVSGDTTSGGLNRLESVISSDPDIVILELGINDAFQKKNLKVTYNNLDKIMSELDENGISILVAAMEAPKYFDKKFRHNFLNMYFYLAKKYKASIMPNFLKDVEGIKRYLQKDNIHPNPRGINIMVRNIYPFVTELIDQKILDEKKEDEEKAYKEYEENNENKYIPPYSEESITNE